MQSHKKNGRGRFWTDEPFGFFAAQQTKEAEVQETESSETKAADTAQEITEENGNEREIFRFCSIRRF